MGSVLNCRPLSVCEELSSSASVPTGSNTDTAEHRNRQKLLLWPSLSLLFFLVSRGHPDFHPLSSLVAPTLFWGRKWACALMCNTAVWWGRNWQHFANLAANRVNCHLPCLEITSWSVMLEKKNDTLVFTLITRERMWKAMGEAMWPLQHVVSSNFILPNIIK